jgi:putative SOS response-associated peptidase YedK
MFNARIETIAERPAFRGALANRRCLVVADAFYEWKTEGRRKRPHVIRTDDAAFAMAGLWESWTSGDGEVIESCTVVTRDAVGAVASLHDRMPVILGPERYDDWLDPQQSDASQLTALLRASARTDLDIEPIDEVPRDESTAGGQLNLFP